MLCKFLVFMMFLSSAYACNCGQDPQGFKRSWVDHIYNEYGIKTVDGDGDDFTITLPIDISDDQSREFIKDHLLKSKACDSEDEIEFFDNRVKVTPKIPKKKGPYNCMCISNCDSFSAIASMACGSLPSFRCKVLCTTAIETLRRGCHRCCDGTEGFMQSCADMILNYVPACPDHWITNDF